MSALARGNDASLVELPREVWSRGSRPLQGRLFRWGVASAIVLLGLTFPMTPVRIGAVAIAALVFFGMFALVDSRLEALGKTLATATRSEAGKLMSGLEDRWMVARFAPHVWVSAQKGRLNMIKGDPRAAAAAFAEAARQSGNAQQPDLIGSQAHALVLSGDPKGARQLLLGMEERKQLRSLDSFNLGVAYVEEPGKTARAVELLESARADLGSAPRTDAALALAYARDGKTEEAASLLEALDESDFDDDDTAKELHKRARRSLRQATDSKTPKGKRKPDSAGADSDGKKKAPRGKKDRRKDRREKRKARGGKKSRKGKRTSADEPKDLNEDVAEKETGVAPGVDEEKAGQTAGTETQASETEAAENAASEKAEAEKEASENAAAEKEAAEKAASEKAASEKEASEKAASEKAASEKEASEKAAAEKAASEKEASEKAASEKEASEKAAAEKAAAEKAAAEKAAAEKAAAEKEAAEKDAAEKEAAEKEAAEKEAAEKEAAEKAASEKEAAEKAAAEKKAIEKAAADKAAEEREARAKAVAEALARSAEGEDPASEEKAKAEAESAARAAAERARERAEAKAKEGAAPEKPLFGSDSQPLFVPPPVPAFGSETGPRNGASTKPVAPKLPAPPKVAPPKVAAPPVVDSAPKKPAIDTDGWDDLFGDD